MLIGEEFTELSSKQHLNVCLSITYYESFFKYSKKSKFFKYFFFEKNCKKEKFRFKLRKYYAAKLRSCVLSAKQLQSDLYQKMKKTIFGCVFLCDKKTNRYCEKIQRICVFIFKKT